MCGPDESWTGFAVIQSTASVTINCKYIHAQAQSGKTIMNSAIIWNTKRVVDIEGRDNSKKKNDATGTRNKHRGSPNHL